MPLTTVNHDSNVRAGSHTRPPPPPVTRAKVRPATFRTQMRGYAPGEVNAALRDAGRELEDREH